MERSGLCTYEEAFCSLAETGGDEIQSLERCRNEAYRWELKLAREVLASTLGSWLAKPRINRKLLHK